LSGWLQAKRDLVEFVLIPLAIFLVDFLLRALVRVDLIDAGADMSLLVLSAFFSGLVASGRRASPNDNASGLALGCLFFFGVWLFCLGLAADQSRIAEVFPLLIPYQRGVAWVTGLLALIGGSMALQDLIEPSSARS